MKEPIHIISLGAGVQSSTMSLMAAKGEITPMPACAIFADTQSEPQTVYDWLEYLKGVLPFPVHIVTQGNLGNDFLAAIRGESNRCGQPPFFVRNPDNFDTGGMLWRECTTEYKLNPIRRKVRELSAGNPVVQWIGISLDEAHRMKDSRVKYITNRYPLIDLRMSRGDCLEWMKRNGFRQPPKSACVFCPYASDYRWKSIKKNDPNSFALACDYDDAMRKTRTQKLAAGIKGELFIHRSMTPLRDAVLSDDNQLDLFGQECEGMCGV